MSRETFHLSHEIISIELCPKCQHPKTGTVETTITKDEETLGTVPIHPQYEHCHTGDEE